MIQRLALVPGRLVRKGKLPLQLIGEIHLRTPWFHSPPCLSNGGLWIAGGRRLIFFPRKEGQMRVELFHREQLTVHADCPFKDITCMPLAQTKDATIVCVIGCQITRTRIHTLPKRLASARHDKTRKTVFLPECTLQTDFRPVSEDEEENDVSSRHPLYCGRAGSDVMGCRRPTSGVFILYASGPGHADDVPHSDP